MKQLIVIALLFLCIITNAQNVGVGTTTTVTRLNVAGSIGWKVSAGEGEMRIRTPLYRLKFGVALNCGGVGAANIIRTQ